MAIPQLVKKAAECDTSKFTIMTISFDTDSVSYFSAIKQLKMEGFKNRYNFSQGFINNPLAKKYGVSHTPTLLYIDEKGNVLATMQAAFVKFIPCISFSPLSVLPSLAVVCVFTNDTCGSTPRKEVISAKIVCIFRLCRCYPRSPLFVFSQTTLAEAPRGKK